MKVNFAKTFNKSLKRMLRTQTWWYKTYSLFRYDLPRFFKNIWRFRKGLWNHYWFDHHGTLKFLEIGLTDMSDRIEKDGMEVDESRLKKVAKMRRVIELIKNYNEDNYIEMAEKELGELHVQGFDIDDFVETGETIDNPLGEKNEKLYTWVDRLTEEQSAHNHKVYERAHEIEEQEWNELFNILKGQNRTEYVMFQDKSENKESAWDNWFDGSDMRGWWD